jgi:hypothetical protein
LLAFELEVLMSTTAWILVIVLAVLLFGGGGIYLRR